MPCIKNTLSQLLLLNMRPFLVCVSFNFFWVMVKDTIKLRARQNQQEKMYLPGHFGTPPEMLWT